MSVLMLEGINTPSTLQHPTINELENFIKTLDAGDDLLLTLDEKARKEDSIDTTKDPIYAPSQQKLDAKDELEESDDDYDDSDDDEDERETKEI